MGAGALRRPAIRRLILKFLFLSAVLFTAAAFAENKIPAGAKEIEPYVYSYTDAQGTQWMYRQTPFGVTKWQKSDVPPPSMPEQPNPVSARDLGDQVRSEPTGPARRGPRRDNPVTTEQELGAIGGSKSQAVTTVVDDLERKRTYTGHNAAPQGAMPPIETLAVTIRITTVPVVRREVEIRIDDRTHCSHYSSSAGERGLTTLIIENAELAASLKITFEQCGAPRSASRPPAGAAAADGQGARRDDPVSRTAVEASSLGGCRWNRSF